ncbi:FecR domain-containing protein [Dongia sp. agr-C8]
MHRRHTRLYPLVAVALAFAALCAPTLMASQTTGWSVVVANNAFVDHGKGDAPVTVVMGANVTPGDRLTTGEGGALVLTRGEDLVTMAENSRIEIVNPQPTSTTLIEQPYGHVEYHVTKEKVPHFQVDAPLLATVVKGTTFSVDASQSKSSVTVSEGRVEAKNRRTGASASVGAGQRGAVETRDRGVDVGNAPGKAASEAPASNNASGGSGDDGNSSGNSSNGKGGGNSGNGNGSGGGNGNSGNGNNGGGNGNSGHGNGNNGNGNNGNGNNGNGNNGNGGGNGSNSKPAGKGKNS